MAALPGPSRSVHAGWLSRLFGHHRLALGSLDEHPNSHEVRSILSRVPTLTENEMARLAGGWRDNNFLAGAREHALSPDSPLIVEVLAAFDSIDDDPASFDTLASASSNTTLKAHVANIAGKAIRDAIAAAYARPILGRAEYIALIGPWRRAFPTDS
jgi:hypothetical protein